MTEKKEPLRLVYYMPNEGYQESNFICSMLVAGVKENNRPMVKIALKGGNPSVKSLIQKQQEEAPELQDDTLPKLELVSLWHEAVKKGAIYEEGQDPLNIARMDIVGDCDGVVWYPHQAYVDHPWFSRLKKEMAEGSRNALLILLSYDPSPWQEDADLIFRPSEPDLAKKILERLFKRKGWQL